MTDSKITSKEILAKLMATENIIVEHANVPTAAFDLKNRKILLPIWKDISDDVYTLLISHEVGHALYTPHSEWHETVKDENESDLKYIINVVEDVRIEKLIQSKFPGTVKSFRVGYNELEQKNIFGTKDRDIQSYGFLDRINIQFKIGHFGYAKVPFSLEESHWLVKIADCNTFSDVVKLSKELRDYLKQTSEENTSKNNSSENTSPKSDNNNSEGEKSNINSDSMDTESEADSSNNSSSSELDSESTPDLNSQSAGDDSQSKTSTQSHQGNSQSSFQSDEQNKELISETQSSFDSGINKYVDKNTEQVVYGNLPELDLKNIIVDYKKVHSEISEFYKKYYSALYDNVASKVESYKLSNRNVVNQLANIFEMKKKAKLDSRALVSRTGKLDNNRVFSYRYNDDIFKKHTTIPAGKSHGLVMFLDMSGSMGSNMLGTYEQLLNLVLFCRRINIPFDVYGFTDNYNSRKTLNKHQFKDRDLIVPQEFSLRQYFSNKMSGSEFNLGIHNILMMMESYRGKHRVGLPSQECLNQTPLVPTILSAMKIVPEFRKRYSLDIVNVIFLSDGDDTQGTQIIKDGKIVDITKSSQRRYYSSSRKNKYFINDPKTKKQWEIIDSTETCLNILKNIAGVKVVGFHIISKRELPNKLSDLGETNVDSKVEYFKTNKYCEVNNAKGYDAYYLIPSDKGLIISSADFDPAIDTTVDWEDQKQAKKMMKSVTKDFSNYMKQNVTNRLLINRFIEHIS
jgi:hypothetical protein